MIDELLLAEIKVFNEAGHEDYRSGEPRYMRIRLEPHTFSNRHAKAILYVGGSLYVSWDLSEPERYKAFQDLLYRYNYGSII